LLLNLEIDATMVPAWIVGRESVDRQLALGALARLAGAILLGGAGAPELRWGRQSIRLACLAWVVGFVGYGASLVLFVVALRPIGSARTAACFSTALFIGALVAVAGFRVPWSAGLAIGGILMAIGMVLHATEQHDHGYEHELPDREHRPSMTSAIGTTIRNARSRASRIPTRIGMRASIHGHPHLPDLHHWYGHRWGGGSGVRRYVVPVRDSGRGRLRKARVSRETSRSAERSVSAATPFRVQSRVRCRRARMLQNTF
jgi:hypothetical protein